MCCSICEAEHESHTKAFFKDPFIEPNYSNVEQVHTQVLIAEATQSASLLQSSSSADKKDALQPNFEVYVGTDKASQDRVQIKLVKDFKSKKQSFQDSVMAQIKTCQLFSNSCKSSQVIHLADHLFLHNNLYLISEEYECSLVEALPFLIKQNKQNDLVSILLVHEVLKTLKNLVKQEVRI